MTPLFIDSAYVIALINDRDQHHENARRLVRHYRRHSFVTSEGVLLEVGNFLSARFRSQAVEVIEQFLMSPDIEIVYTTPQLLVSALALYKRMSDKEWSLVDCISFVIMRERGIREALTSDHHFTQAGFEALLVVRQ